MARPTEFVDPDYDRRLAEFKARKAEMKAEMGIQEKPAKAAERPVATREPVKSSSNQVARRY